MKKFLTILFIGLLNFTSNIFADDKILNLLQADIMKRLNKKNINTKSKKILMDAMIVTISGISASMKNTG